MNTFENNEDRGSEGRPYSSVTPALLSTPVRKGLAILIGALAVIAVLGLIATQSKPGQALYGIKTGVIEEIAQGMRFTAKDKAEYQVNRLEERLEELKAIDPKTVDEGTLTILNTQATEHSDTLTNIVEESIDSAFPKADVLYTLNEFASIAGAMEAVGENSPELMLVGDHMEDIRRNTANLYKDRAESFTQTEEPAAVFQFIQDRLQEVKNELSNADLSEDTIDDAENYLERVGPAVAENDLAKAITAMAEAYRFIKIEKYGGKLESAAVEENAATSTEDATSTPLNNSTTTSTTTP